MSQLVHVIHPSGSPRWERSFGDKATPEQILAELRGHGSRVQIGFVGTIVKTDEETGFENVPHSDKASGYVMDHPDTVVAIGRAEGREFVEDRCIAGPERTPEPVPALKLAEAS